MSANKRPEVSATIRSFQSGAGKEAAYITFVAARMMRIRMISTTTPIIIIILMFFHQYFRATRVDVFWKESAWNEKMAHKTAVMEGKLWLFTVFYLQIVWEVLNWFPILICVKISWRNTLDGKNWLIWLMAGHTKWWAKLTTSYSYNSLINNLFRVK